MKMLPSLALVLAIGLAPAAYLIAQDAPGETPADKKPAKAVKVPRLTAPWSKMGSLTPEQKVQIGSIHKAALAEKKAIDDKEEADILALLSPEQKDEVEKLKEGSTAAKKAAPKAAATPATQPDAGM